MSPANWINECRKDTNASTNYLQITLSTKVIVNNLIMVFSSIVYEYIMLTSPYNFPQQQLFQQISKFSNIFICFLSSNLYKLLTNNNYTNYTTPVPTAWPDKKRNAKNTENMRKFQQNFGKKIWKNNHQRNPIQRSPQKQKNRSIHILTSI